MKVILVTRNIFRGMLLISLLFRLFFVGKLSYAWDIISYISLAIGLIGMVVLDIIIKNKKKKNVW